MRIGKLDWVFCLLYFGWQHGRSGRECVVCLVSNVISHLSGVVLVHEVNFNNSKRHTNS